jgi:predicted DCC family thiol-disulfide oxidoreductase YuxK
MPIPGSSDTASNHASSPPTVFFDGVCNLCNWSVRFIIKRDPRGQFRFAALQSDAARALLAKAGVDGQAGDTMLLLEDGRLFDRSTAALRIARRLRFPWRLAYGLIILPRPLRDWLYRIIARHRYRWFGKRDVCMVPTPELQSRFV